MLIACHCGAPIYIPFTALFYPGIGELVTMRCFKCSHARKACEREETGMTHNCTATPENVTLMEVTFSCGDIAAQVTCPEKLAGWKIGEPVTTDGTCPACGIPATAVAFNDLGNDAALAAIAGIPPPGYFLL